MTTPGRTLRRIAVTGACLVVVQALTIGAAAPQAVVHPVVAALVGSWTGTLEYRDFRTDRRVTLPTTLVVAPAEGLSLRLDYAYDEGEGRVVTSTERVTIAAAPPSYRVQSGDGKDDTTFEAQGLAEVRDGGGTVILTGRGRENDEAVDLRTTLTVTPSTLTMRRDSRRAGDDWQFRHQYSFGR